MLRKYSNSRTHADNVKLGTLTALVAGMVNVASLVIFLSFSSNVTGYFAIFATEIVNGNYLQIFLVGSWIFLYLFGAAISNFMIINFSKKNTYLAHAIPIFLEIVCILTVGIYTNYFYQNTLLESELLLSLLLFAMGLQNGLTASISNFAVKTTHLTGAITDLGVLLSMFTKKRFRQRKELVEKATLISSILFAYVIGGILFAYLYKLIGFKMFFVIVGLLLIIVCYDWYKIGSLKWKLFKHKKLREVDVKLSQTNNAF